MQGPPGTGKTRTLLALLEVLARIAQVPGRANAMGPILACADTNAATDNIVEGLIERGINVTRLGQPAKVCAHMQSLAAGLTLSGTCGRRRGAMLHTDASRPLCPHVSLLSCYARERVRHNPHGSMCLRSTE